MTPDFFDKIVLTEFMHSLQIVKGAFGEAI